MLLCVQKAKNKKFRLRRDFHFACWGQFPKPQEQSLSTLSHAPYGVFFSVVILFVFFVFISCNSKDIFVILFMKNLFSDFLLNLEIFTVSCFLSEMRAAYSLFKDFMEGILFSFNSSKAFLNMCFSYTQHKHLLSLHSY